MTGYWSFLEWFRTVHPVDFDCTLCLLSCRLTLSPYSLYVRLQLLCKVHVLLDES